MCGGKPAVVPSIELIGGGKNIFITVLFKKHKDYIKAVLVPSIHNVYKGAGPNFVGILLIKPLRN